MDRSKDIEIQEKKYDEETEIDLIELMTHYLHNIRWIIGGFFAGALAAVLLTCFVIAPKYTATAKMYMVSSGSQSVVDLSDFNVGQSLSSDYVELLKTKPIIEGVIKEQKLDYTYRELTEDMIKLSVVNDTRIVLIEATSKDKKEAMQIANALAEKGVSELPKLMETPEPHIAEYATVPLNKSSPSLTKNTMIGALLGLLIMLSVFTVQFLTDDTFKTAEDIQKEFGIMPLTVIPEGHIEGAEKEDDNGSKRPWRRGRRKKADE